MRRGTALITGASSGIGCELARIMAEDGWDLVLVARRAERLAELAQELERVAVHTIVMDLAEDGAARRIAERLSRDDLVIDALVNNAGLGDHNSFVDSDWEKNRAMIRVNVEALTELTRILVPPMISRGRGAVLNVASVASFQPGPLMAVYYATKAYVLSLSEALSEELRGSGVTVTALCPGPTRSGFQESANLASVVPMNRSSNPTAEVVARFGYRAMLRGKDIAIHGAVFKVLVFISRFLPRRIVTKAVARYQGGRRN